MMWEVWLDRAWQMRKQWQWLQCHLPPSLPPAAIPPRLEPHKFISTPLVPSFAHQSPLPLSPPMGSSVSPPDSSPRGPTVSTYPCHHHLISVSSHSSSNPSTPCGHIPIAATPCRRSLLLLSTIASSLHHRCAMATPLCSVLAPPPSRTALAPSP